MRNDKGFTLIELILVISIIIIVAIIAIPRFSNIMDKQKEKSCIANRNNLIHQYNLQSSIDESLTLDNFIENSSSYFGKEVTCPSNGEYSVVDGEIICSVHGSAPIDEDDTQNDEEEQEEDEEDDETNNYPEWDSSKSHYVQDEIVSYNGGIFKTRNWVSGNVVPGTVGAPWQELTDDWRNFNVYQSGDVVNYSGASFKARDPIWPTTGNPGGTPGVVGVRWQELTDEWRNFNQYNRDDTVIYNGATYIARDPIWPSTGNPGGTPGDMNAPWNEDTIEWRNFNVYQGGSEVIYNGSRYRAKWYSKNDTPGSANVWEKIE